MVNQISNAQEFKMGWTSILLISAGLVLALSIYSEAYSRGKFIFMFSLKLLHWKHLDLLGLNDCYSKQTGYFALRDQALQFMHAGKNKIEYTQHKATIGKAVAIIYRFRGGEYH